MLEPGRPQPLGAGEVAAVAGHEHVHASEPGVGLERLLGSGDGGGPHALEKVADLLDAGDVLIQELFAAHSEVTQPAPGLVDGSGR